MFTVYSYLASGCAFVRFLTCQLDFICPYCVSRIVPKAYVSLFATSIFILTKIAIICCHTYSEFNRMVLSKWWLCFKFSSFTLEIKSISRGKSRTYVRLVNGIVLHITKWSVATDIWLKYTEYSLYTDVSTSTASYTRY